MSFRFYKRIKIAPGLSINFGKSGASLSVGPKGAKMTIGPKGIRKTVGIPGTGLYYTEHTSRKKVVATPRSAPSNSVPQAPSSPGMGLVIISLILLAINVYGAFSDGRPQAFVVTPFLGLLCVYAFSRRKRLMDHGGEPETFAPGVGETNTTLVGTAEPVLMDLYQDNGKIFESVSINMTELDASLGGVIQIASMADPAVLCCH